MTIVNVQDAVGVATKGEQERPTPRLGEGIASWLLPSFPLLERLCLTFLERDGGGG